MNPVIQVTSDTSVIAECDETCYDSPDAQKPCVCGLNNRGIGFDRAIANNLVCLKQIRARISKRWPNARRIDIVLPARQCVHPHPSNPSRVPTTRQIHLPKTTQPAPEPDYPPFGPSFDHSLHSDDT